MRRTRKLALIEKIANYGFVVGRKLRSEFGFREAELGEKSGKEEAKRGRLA
jgi:hypothetical protein